MNERKIKKHEENIAKIRKQIMFLEAVKLQKDYVSGDYMGRFKLDTALQFDLSRSIISITFNELFADFIKNDFYLILNRDNVDYYAFSKLIREKESVIFSESEKLYRAGELTDSISYLEQTLDTKKIDIIKLLIENNQYELITKIIISEEIEEMKKIDVIKRIMEYAPDQLKKIFSIIPSDYRYFKSEKKYEEHIKNLIDTNLSLIKKDNDYIFNKVREVIKQKNSDSLSMLNAREFVKFFIEHNLIDINKVDWHHYSKEVTSAAASCVIGNYDMFEYLYKLKEYKNIDKKVRDHSDKVIIFDILNYKYIGYLINFLEMVNFEANPNKLRYLSAELLKINEKERDKISSEKLEKIIYLFLRKTKKEDYKEMLKVVEELRINMNPVAKEEARQNLVKILRDLNNKLIEEVPAKTIVGDAKILKK